MPDSKKTERAREGRYKLLILLNLIQRLYRNIERLKDYKDP